MDLASLVGIISGLSLIISAIVLGGDVYNFWNVPGVMIVVGGTTAATLLTFPFSDVLAAFRAAHTVFRRDKQDPNDMVATMLKLSHISRRKGLVGLSEVKTSSPFIKRVCNLIADAADEGVIRATLRTEIDSLKTRHYIQQDVFRRMAVYAPAFGMLGTLIGLIQMLSQLHDPSSIGPAMSIALLTTFYGSLLSTMFFLPIAGKLKARTLVEVINLEIAYEGAVSILEDNNALSVYEKLSAFIPKSMRRPIPPLKERSAQA
jgi:chemotaxis protein MotA